MKRERRIERLRKQTRDGWDGSGRKRWCLLVEGAEAGD